MTTQAETPDFDQEQVTPQLQSRGTLADQNAFEYLGRLFSDDVLVGYTSAFGDEPSGSPLSVRDKSWILMRYQSPDLPAWVRFYKTVTQHILLDDRSLKFGEPKCAQDLQQRLCVIDSNFRIGKQWPIQSPDGTTESVEVQASASANSPRAVKEIYLAGGGIGMMPKFIVEPELQAGLLQEILPGYRTLKFGLFAIYPHRKYLSRKVRCFIDFMTEEFGKGY